MRVQYIRFSFLERERAWTTNPFLHGRRGIGAFNRAYSRGWCATWRALHAICPMGRTSNFVFVHGSFLSLSRNERNWIGPIRGNRPYSPSFLSFFPPFFRTLETYFVIAYFHPLKQRAESVACCHSRVAHPWMDHARSRWEKNARGSAMDGESVIGTMYRWLALYAVFTIVLLGGSGLSGCSRRKENIWERNFLARKRRRKRRRSGVTSPTVETKRDSSRERERERRGVDKIVRRKPW